uniref:Acyl_transf_3 domain-containing protein n=1 Tax=Steinernema glaseri TaxID=37863 RepID=A0A1I7Y977_9BILA
MSDMRADLQGFRGFSAILLLLFGLFSRTFKNGFTGIDVFFVLSGYVSQMQYADKATTINGIYKYFGNKITGIFPIYFVALLGTLLVGSLFLPAGYSDDLISDAKWAILFASNWKGYFTNKGFYMQEYSFLHHTWVISLQLQYFLIAPFLFLQLSRCRTAEMKLTVCYVTAFISFLFQLSSSGPSSSESLCARLWQFQVGAISCLSTPSRELLEEQKRRDFWAYEQSEIVGKKWREEGRFLDC